MRSGVAVTEAHGARPNPTHLLLIRKPVVRRSADPPQSWSRLHRCKEHTQYIPNKYTHMHNIRYKELIRETLKYKKRIYNKYL